jgi:hypothetical protein
MNDLPNFDPIAIGNQIAELEADVQNEFAAARQAAKNERSTARKTADSEYVAAKKAAETKYRSRSKEVAELLWSVKQNCPDILNAVCKRAGIGRSRKFELLRIGSGDKTVEQSRKETAVRQRTFKAKKKAESVTTTPKVTDSAKEPPKAGNGTDPDESAAKMKAAHAANESKAAPPKKKTNKKATSKPDAKSEFAYACNHWLPLMSKRDQVEALKYANDVIERSRIPADITESASEIDPTTLN